MIQVKESKNYYINARALSFSENDLGNTNRVAVSIASGTVIMAYYKGTIDYAADGNFERWTLKGYSTKLAQNTPYYIYARLSRTEPTAMVLFSPNLYELDGSIADSETPTPSTEYWYVRIGQLTETDGTSLRELTYDSGLLSTDKGVNESNSALEEMFELNKQSTPWYIQVKHWFLSLTIKNALTLMGNLVWKGNSLTGVAKSSDQQYIDTPSNEILATTAYVDTYIDQNLDDITSNKYLRKDQEDSTEYEIDFKSQFAIKSKPVKDIIRYTDEQKSVASDENFYSSLMTNQRIEDEVELLNDRFIRKDQDDATEYDVNFKKQFSIRSKPIKGLIRYYDEPRDVSTDANFYSSLMTDQRIEEEIEALDDRYLRKDKEDTAHKHITFEEGITVYDLAKILNLQVDELATIAEAIINVVRSKTFIDGFSGEGYQIWKNIASGDWSMTIDRLTVRKTLTVFEMIVQKIRAVGGMIVVSAADGKIKEVKKVGQNYHITFEGTNTFAPNDLMRCQVFSEGSLKYYWVEIAAVSDNIVSIPISEFEGAVPEVGDECVLMGNTLNTLRQNLILLSATEDGQPRFDCLDGVNSKSLEGCLKVRVGSLDGISDDRFPADKQPQGYGLYGNNCYLTGVFVLSNGKDVMTMFSIMEGIIQSEISSLRSEISIDDNYLNNASFSNDTEYWDYYNEIKPYETGGSLLYFNSELYSEFISFVGIIKDGNRNVLRIKDSYITQANEDFAEHPAFELYEQFVTDEDGNEVSTGETLYRPKMFYISFYYKAITSGTLKVLFQGESPAGFEEYTPINYEKQIEATNEYAQIEIAGKWNGTGNVYLSYTGDMYLYSLALADNKLADLEERYDLKFEMTEKAIQVNADHIIENSNKLEEYHAEFLLTAEQMRVEFNKLIDDTEAEITEEYQGAISASAESLTSDYTKLIDDSEKDITEAYTSKIEQTAEGLTATFTTDIKDLEDALVADYDSKIQASSESLTSEFNAQIVNLKNGDIAAMKSNISQNASGIEANASKISDLDESYAALKIQADGISSTVSTNKTESDKAIAAANAAASAAQSTANSASTAAGKAQTAANNAQSTADDAADAASDAQTAANNAQTTANNALNKATTNATAIVQTQDYISLIAGNFNDDGSFNNAAGWITTAQGNQLWASIDSVDDLEDKYAALKIQADGISSTVSTNKTESDKAIAAANAAASAAQSTANSASTAAGKAQTAADNAASAASKAQTSANNAQSTADAASDAASDAQTAANNAQTTANNALNKATTNATAIVQTQDYISLIAGNFNEDGSISSAAGVVFKSEFASLYATQTTAQGVAKTAEIKAYVDDEIAGITLTADKIIFEGYTNINNSFIVDSDGVITLGGFTVTEDTLKTTTYGYGRVLIEPGVNKFLRINESSSEPLLYARNDDGTIMQLNAYGDDATALELLSNSPGKGVALNSIGDATLIGRFSSATSLTNHEQITIAGLSLSYKNGTVFTSPSNVSPSTAWTDFLVATGNVTLPDPTKCPGKVLFVKCNGTIQSSVGIVKADAVYTSPTTTSYSRDKHAMIYISNGTYWFEYYCG